MKNLQDWLSKVEATFQVKPIIGVTTRRRGMIHVTIRPRGQNWCVKVRRLELEDALSHAQVLFWDQCWNNCDKAKVASEQTNRAMRRRCPTCDSANRGSSFPAHAPCDDPWHRRADAVARCPTCDSPSPGRHPAMQWEGEVQICPDPWHGTIATKE